MMNWWIISIVACATEVALVYAFLVMRGSKASVTTRLIRSPNPTKRLQLHLNGFGGHGDLQFANVQDEVLRHGDLRVVYYDGMYGKNANAFNPRDVIDVVLPAVIADLNSGRYYDGVEIYGTSMGGKFAYEIAQYLGMMKNPVPTQVHLIDAPLGLRDLQPVQRFLLAPAIIALPFVPLFNLAMVVRPIERFVVKMTFPAPPKKDFEDGLTATEMSNLKMSTTLVHESRLSFCRDQVKAMLRRIPEKLIALQSPWGPDDVVFIHSLSDKEVVDGVNAVRSWAELLRTMNLRVIGLPEAKHAAYGYMPQKYRQAFHQAWSIFKA